MAIILLFLSVDQMAQFYSFNRLSIFQIKKLATEAHLKGTFSIYSWLGSQLSRNYRKNNEIFAIFPNGHIRNNLFAFCILIILARL